ncbi:MAG: hypothetical protein V3V14_03275 [Saprospiraceae bacterium]
MSNNKGYSFIGGKGNPLGSTGMIIGLIVVMVALFFLAQGVFWLLSKLAIGLFIIALIMDYTVVTDYLKFVWKLLKENPIMGIIAIVLTVVGYPVVAGLLFGKALMKRQIKKVFGPLQEKAAAEEEFTDFEEIEDDVLELPKLKKTVQQRGTTDSDYEQLFD